MIKNTENCMRQDVRGTTTFITERFGLRCITCKKELFIGEFRYPIWTSENYNRCAECYYLIAETKTQGVLNKAYQS